MKKVFVVVEVLSDIDKLSRCINSIINQSFKNIELLIINNNPDKDIIDLLNSYENEDIRVNVLNDYNLLNLHQIRTLGFSKCNGDYISFINSNDYLSCDYFRTVLNELENTGSDINICNYVSIQANKSVIYNFISSNERVVNSKDALNNLLESCGSNNRLYKLELKCINATVAKNIFKEYSAMDICSELVDDATISAMLYCESKKVSFLEQYQYYMSFNLEQRHDLDLSCLKKYLSRKKLLKGNSDFIECWNVWDSPFYASYSDYDDGLELIKKKIMDADIDIVSFDMFDTLVVRPFYKPSDMFELMDKTFIKLSNYNKVIKFSKIRFDSEVFLRKESLKNGICEVKIDDIYNYIKDFYSIPYDIVLKMKNLEEELEIKYCTKRHTAYDLYELSRFINKKVIVTTDIYMNRNTIEEILRRNEYDFDHIYISSELLKTKSDGSLFHHIKETENKRILHIGDNVNSDVKMAEKNNIVSAYFPRTIDVFMNETSINVNSCGNLFKEFDMFNINMNAYLKCTGVRCSLALVANYYFDNPFRPFMFDTKFNSDANFIGYYCLGMHLLSLSNWILNDIKSKKIDNISFMSRDGYLPLKSTQILQNNTTINNDVNLDYIYISRKAMFPLLFSGKEMINILQTYVDYNILTINDLFDILKPILKYSNYVKYKDILCINGFDEKKFKNKFEFFNCLKLIFEKLIDEKKYNDYFNLVKLYFRQHFNGNSAAFDIGYSGKPEAIISYMLDKPVNTYFYHSTSSEAYSNSVAANFNINLFYDFMPTLTGTIRELFYSDVNPSCIGYKKNGDEILPVFAAAEKYTYFNKQMIRSVQDGALKFVNDFSSLFGDSIELFDLNRFYMSVPYEFFNHYISENDRIIFKDLVFESNVGDSKFFVDYIDGILDDYKYYNKEHVEKIIDNDFHLFKQFIYDKMNDNMHDELKYKMRQEIAEDIKNELLNTGYTALPKNRLGRIFYYIIFDNKKIILKIRKKIRGNR